MLVHVHRTLQRNKAFDTGRVQGRSVAALDGIEVLSSYSRCCDSCLERRVMMRKNGIQTERCSIIIARWAARSSAARSSRSSPSNRSNLMKESRPHSAVAPQTSGSLWQLFLRYPAARRFARSNRGAGLGAIGWDVLISLKQSQPDLYKYAIRLFGQRPPDTALTEQRDHETYEVLLWDTEGLPFSGRIPAWSASSVRKNRHPEPLP